MKLHQKLSDLAEAVASEGGRLFVVGGWVRDVRIGRPAGDVDCEIHLMSSDRLVHLLKRGGSVSRVGRSFGVYKWTVQGECFDVHLVESELGLEDSVDEATQRRDFRCNALLFDPLSGRVIDPTGGLTDLERRLLRVVHPSRFGEDPLRALRGPRFVATLGFKMDEEARNLCRKQDLKDLPGERVWGELRRLLAGEYVDKGWTLLRELGLLEQLFPGLEGLHNVEIESHMGLICQSGCTLDEPGLMAVQLTLATLAVSEAEVALVFKRLRLDRVGGVSLQRAVRGLRAWTQEVQHQDLRDEAILRLSEEWPVQWGGAIYAALHGGDGLEDVMRRAVALGVAQGPLPVLLTGEELLRRGVDAGPKVGHLLKEARELQLRGHLTTSGEALKWLEQELSRD